MVVMNRPCVYGRLCRLDGQRHREEYTPGMSDLDSKWVRLAPNGISGLTFI